MPFASGFSLVTGASSGIGKAIAKRLASDGYHVLINYNQNEAGARQTQAEIAQAGGQSDLLKFNVADSKEVDAALEKFFSQGSPDLPLLCLVNNAGIHRDSLLGLMSDEAFDQVMKTNLYGSFYLLRWCVKRMIRQKQGSIVNMASLAGQIGNVGQINYGASKAALISMTQTLALEVGSRGIRVNAVAPGLIETEMVSQIPHLDELKKRIPLGRLGRPEEVAAAVSFLCSSESSYMTGCTLSLNGGLFPS